MEQIKNVIRCVVGQISARVSRSDCFTPEEWLKKSLTRKELGHIKFYYFRRGVLGIKVDSSAWKHNFYYAKRFYCKDSKMRPEVHSYILL